MFRLGLSFVRTCLAKKLSHATGHASIRSILDYYLGRSVLLFAPVTKQRRTSNSSPI